MEHNFIISSFHPFFYHLTSPQTYLVFGPLRILTPSWETSSYFWHQLIQKTKLAQWRRGTSVAGLRGQERVLSVLRSLQQRESSLFGLLWKARLSSASDVLRLEAKSVTEGAFCTALCPLPGSYREAVLRCYMEKQQGKLKNLSPLGSSAERRGR